MHNPEHFVRLVRDHVAAHDKRLVFLFGAGTSSAVKVEELPAAGAEPTQVPLIPAVWGMTDKCAESVRILGDPFETFWTDLVRESVELGSEPHIENLLSRVRLKLAAAGPADTVMGLTTDQLRAVDQSVRTEIARLAHPSDTRIPHELPHDAFAQWVKNARRVHPVEIFTTNYDVLLERSLERARVPIFDGFVGSYEPFFNPDCLESDAAMPGRDWTRLWKVHGSINWRMRGTDTIRTFATTEGEMVLPSHQKYDESRKMPYLALMDRLARTLSHDGTLLVSCGYSWNDEHINAIILSALENQPSNSVIALMHGKLDANTAITAAAGKTRSILAAARDGAILRGFRGAWSLPEVADRAVSSFLDIGFDSNAMLDDADGPIGGELRLGDFQRFTQFLASVHDRGSSE